MRVLFFLLLSIWLVRSRRKRTREDVFANGNKWLFKLFSASMVVMWNFNGMNPEVRYIQLYRHRYPISSWHWWMLVVIVISDHRNYIILKQTSYLTSMEVFYIKSFPNGSLWTIQINIFRGPMKLSLLYIYIYI